MNLPLLRLQHGVLHPIDDHFRPIVLSHFLFKMIGPKLRVRKDPKEIEPTIWLGCMELGKGIGKRWLRPLNLLLGMSLLAFQLI